MWAGAHELAEMDGHRARHCVAGLISSKEHHLCFIRFSREAAPADTWHSVLPCMGILSGRKIKEGEGIPSLKEHLQDWAEGASSLAVRLRGMASSSPALGEGGTRLQGLECHTQQLGWAYRALRHRGVKKRLWAGTCLGHTVLGSNPSSTVHEGDGLGTGERREGPSQEMCKGTTRLWCKSPH